MITPSDNRVLLIGNSHTYIPGGPAAYPNYDVDCYPGRTSDIGLALLDEDLRPRHKKVAFDLATADTNRLEAYKEDIRNVYDRIGPDRCLILTTTWVQYPNPYGFNQGTSLNNFLKSFSENHDRVCILDWAAWAMYHPEWYGSDGVHFTGAAYSARVQMETWAVNNCPSPS